MQHSARAAVTAAAFAVMTGQRVGSVVDQSTGQMLPISAACDGDTVTAYDPRRGGTLTGTLPGLYDHAAGTHVDMKRGDGKITGFHYQSGSFYQVIVSGKLAEMFDFADNSWSAFTMG